MCRNNTKGKIMMEWQLQKQCFQWFIAEYPAHSKILCYNMNNSNSHIEGNKYKSIGLQAGRADMVLYFNSAATMIEFKIDNGEQSEKQKEWELAVRMQGFEYYVIRSFGQFEILIHWLIDGWKLDGFYSLQHAIDYDNWYKANNN